MTIKNVIKYISFDGKKFDTESDCLKHEQEVMSYINDPKIDLALRHGFYGTMYGNSIGTDKAIWIQPFEAEITALGNLYYVWGYPGPDFNIYKSEDYGKTWCLNNDDWIIE